MNLDSFNWFQFSETMEVFISWRFVPQFLLYFFWKLIISLRNWILCSKHNLGSVSLFVDWNQKNISIDPVKWN